MIQNLNILNQKVQNLELLTSQYYEWKKETEEFRKYLDKKGEEIAKDRAKDSSNNDRQQDVPERKKGNKPPKKANKKK